MCSRTETAKSTGTYSDKIAQLKKKLDQADAVVIGAGAGLSASAGFAYTGERFERYFGDFIAQYGFRDMYSGGFYHFDTLEEHWGYWSRYIYINRYMDAPKPVYEDLLHLVRNKDYFVLTTNVDHCFQKAGFDKQRLFYTQGDYGLWQCSRPCHQKTYDNEAVVKRMVAEQKDRKVPRELVPRCPICGAPMSMNLRTDDTFVEDEGWNAAAERYEAYLQRHETGRILYLELGVGGNTPEVIKYPFWRMTLHNPQATYASINLTEVLYLREIQKQSICIVEDIGSVLQTLLEKKQQKED